MNGEPLDPAGTTSLAEQIDLACDAFEKKWHSQPRPSIDETLQQLPPEARPGAFRELLSLELELRRQAGESPTLADYQLRFSEFGDDLATIFSRSLTGPTVQSLPGDATLCSVESAESGTTDQTISHESLGNYEILEEIGHGGMGVVYKARHRKMKRLVALKVLPAGVTRNETAVLRFEREVEVISRLAHPNVVTAYDADEASGVHFLVMEYVAGEDLTALVRREGPLAAGVALDYTLQAARGLGYAHQQGIIHRDVKPSNMLLSSDGTIKILDLGLARLNETAESPPAAADLTNTTAVMGTVDYMSPEQGVNTRHADARSDIYSLGCTLYFLLTGRSLYGGETVIERLLAHRDQPIPQLSEARPDAPAGLQAVFARMVAKRADGRFQSMDEVIAALQNVATATSRPAAAVRAPANRRRLLIGAGAVGAALVLLAGIIIKITHKDRTTTEIEVPEGSRIQIVNTPEKAAATVVPAVAPEVGPPTVAAADAPPVDPKSGLPLPAEPVTLPAWELPAGAPEPAIVPFNPEQAKQHQAAWAKYLKRQPVEKGAGGLEFALVPPGEFTLSLTSENGDAEEVDRLRRKIRLTTPFYLGTTEVTREQFRRFVDATGYKTDQERNPVVPRESRNPISMEPQASAEFNWQKPGNFDVDPQMPVTQVSISDIGAYCSWLTQQDGMLYRLPTEAEWQFAYRAGGTYYPSNAREMGDLSRLGWLWTDLPQVDAAKRIAPITRVAQMEPSPWGIFDQVGNAWESCIGAVESTQFENSGRLNPVGSAGYSLMRSNWRPQPPPDDRWSWKPSNPPTESWAYVGYRLVRELPDAGRFEPDAVRLAAPNDSQHTEPSLPVWKSPAGAPPLAIVPFSFAKAHQHQERWGKYLKRRVEETNSIGMPLRLIPPGEFRIAEPHNQMGATAKREPVRLTRAFYIGATEVSVAQFRKFAEATGHQTDAERGNKCWTPTPAGGVLRSENWRHDSGADWKTPGTWSIREDEPVVAVSASDAATFCEWLSKQEGARYRLPTEEEWSFACCAGINSEQAIPVGYGSISDWVWTGKAEGFPVPHSPLLPVASLRANPFGLYHTHGNVYEWSLRRAGHGSALENSWAPRGASWVLSGRTDLPFADLSRLETADVSASDVGFRIVRELDDWNTKFGSTDPVIQLTSTATMPLSDYALVSRPATIPGLKSWTVEHRGLRAQSHAVASPDGKRVATFSDSDATIRVWDDKFELKQMLWGRTAPIKAAAISPDGRWLAARYRSNDYVQNAVNVWDLESGTLVHSLNSEGEQLEWSPDSRYVALSADGYFEYNTLEPSILDVRSGRLTALPGRVTGSGALRVAWSPDGLQLMVGVWCSNPDVGCRIRLYDVATKKLLSDHSAPELNGSRAMVPVWSPQGDRALLTGQGKLLVWNIAEGKATDGPEVAEGSMVWMPDGKSIVISGGAGVGLWNLSDNKFAQTIISTQQGADVAWLDGGKRLARLNSDVLQTFDPQNWKLLLESRRDRRGDTSVSVITLDSASRAVTHSEWGNLTFWNAATGEFDSRRSGVPYSHRLASSPDGATVAISGGHQQVFLAGRDGKQTRELAGHTADVYSAAWSPDGRHLVTGGADQTVRLWDIETGKSTHTLTCSEPVFGVGWSPDGELVAAVTRKELSVWKAASGEPARAPIAVNGEVLLYVRGNPLAWSTDSKHLLISVPTQLLQVDWQTGNQAVTAGGMYTLAQCVSLAPDGRRLVSGTHVEHWGYLHSPLGTAAQRTYGLVPGPWMPDSRRTVTATGAVLRAFDTERKERLGVLIPRFGGEQFVCISPEGHYRGSRRIDDHLVYVALHDDGSQKTYTPEEFRQKFGWKNDPQKARFLELAPEDKPLQPPQPVSPPEPTGQPLSAGFDWPAVDGTPAVDLPADQVSKDGAVAISSRALVPRPLPIEGLRSWSVDLAQHRGKVSGTAVHPSGLLVATAGADDGTIRLWDLTGRLRRILRGHGIDSIRKSVTDLIWSPDGRWLASAGNDRTLRVWDAVAGRLQQTHVLEFVPEHLAWSADGTHIAAAALYDWALVDLVNRKTDSRLKTSGGLDLWWPEPGLLSILGSDGVIRTWDLQIQALDGEQRLADFSAPGICAAVSADRQAVALIYGPEGQRLGIWDLRTGALRKSIEDAPRIGERIAWGADGRLATARGRLRIWDSATLQEQWNSPEFWELIGIGWVRGGRLAAAVRGGLRFYDRDGELLSANSEQGRGPRAENSVMDLDNSGNVWWNRPDRGVPALCWNLPTGQLIGSIQHHANRVRVSPDGKWLADWGSARVLNARTGVIVQQIRVEKQSGELAWSHDSKFIAIARQDGAVNICDPGSGASISELQGAGAVLRHVQFSPDDRRLAAASDMPGKLAVWDVPSKDILWQAEGHGGNGTTGSAFDWSPDGAELAAWKMDSSIVRVDAASGKPRGAAIPARGWGGEIRYSPDGKYLAVTEFESTAVLELASGQVLRLPFVGMIRWLPGTQILVLLPWLRDSEVIAYDVGRRRYEGTLLPRIDDSDLCVGPDGHYRGSPGIEQHLVYIAEHEDGRMETYTPADFARRFGWKNDPERARIIPATSNENVAIEGPDRTAAAWVVAKGGSAAGYQDGQKWTADPKSPQLPAGRLRLTSVRLEDIPGITDNDLARLAGLTWLNYLRLGPSEITDRGLQHLRQLPQLTTLAMGGGRFTVEGLQQLHELPTLLILGVDARAAPDGDLRPLFRFEGLRSLQITGVSNRELASLEELDAPGLHELVLIGKVNEPCPALDRFQERNPRCRVIIGKSARGKDPVRIAAELLRSKGATFTGAPISDSKTPNPWFRVGPEDSFPDESFQLWSISIPEQSEITAEDLKLVDVFPFLSSCEIFGPIVNDETIADICRCRSLTLLTLPATKISDRVHESLLKLPRLEHLRIGGISDADLARLRRAFPDCAINGRRTPPASQ